MFSFAGSQTDPPYPRHLEKICYDSRQDLMVLYGGAEMKTGSAVLFPEYIEEWDKLGWHSYKGPGPGSRLGHALVYHPKDRVTLLLGGVTEKPGESRVNLDVWSWNGKFWKQVSSDCPAKSLEAVYDPVSNRILAYGDVYEKTRIWKGGDPRSLELWEFRSNQWRQLSSEGPQIASPFEMAFDIKRETLVVPHWENGNAVVWEWKNGKWKKLVCSGNFPEERNRYALAYHQPERGTFLFGGRNDLHPYLGDFWKWDGRQWTKLDSPEMPAKRAAANMEYGKGNLYLYGGVTEWGLTNEIWEWKKGKWKLLNPEYAMNASRKADELKEWISRNPEDPNALLQYGSLLKNLKRYAESEALLKKAIMLRPADHNILIGLISVLYDQGKVPEGNGYIIETVTSGIMTRKSYQRLGDYLFSIHKIQPGILCYEKAVASEPLGSDYFSIALGYSKLLNRDKAFEALTKAIDQGFGTREQVANEKSFEPLRSDVRWIALMEKLK